MSLVTYLRGKMIPICCGAIGALCLLAFMLFMGTGIPYVITALIVVLLLGVLCFLAGYFRRLKRLNNLKQNISQITDKYLLGEILDRPADGEEAEYFYIMKTVSAAAIDAVHKEAQAKEEYCDYVSAWVHEIKTPLTAASLILSNGGDMSKLRRELKKAENLTENILYYARLKTIEKDTQIVETQLKPLVQRALQGEMELLIAAGIKVDIQGDATVFTDEKLLIFIIKQFLINCSKYCTGCEIKVGITDNRLVIEDDGPGIPPHELSRVTERGFTGKGYRSAGGSTGMGLYIAHTLCKQMNIHMYIESEEGEYTRIILMF